MYLNYLMLMYHLESSLEPTSSVLGHVNGTNLFYNTLKLNHHLLTLKLEFIKYKPLDCKALGYSDTRQLTMHKYCFRTLTVTMESKPRLR